MQAPDDVAPPSADDPRTVVWIDARKARLFVSRAGGRLEKIDVASDRRASRSGADTRHSGDDNVYLNAVIAAIPAGGDVLIIGPPGRVKDELLAQMQRMGPEFVERIRGVETSTATSDGQLLARAKAFFYADKAAGRPARL